MGVDGSSGEQTTMLKMRTWGGHGRGRVRKGDAVSEGQKSIRRAGRCRKRHARGGGGKQKGRKEGRRMGAGVKTAGAQGRRLVTGGRCGSRKPRARVGERVNPKKVRGLRGTESRAPVQGLEGGGGTVRPEGDRGRGRCRDGRRGWGGVGRRAAQILTPPGCGPPCAPRPGRPPPRAARRSHAAAARTARR